MEKKRFENCSMYRAGNGWGSYHLIKCKWIEVEIVEYAQYPSALKVSFLEKGKRKPVGFMMSYKPSLVIAKGWECPEPPSMWAPSDDPYVKASKYSSCDPGWERDFNKEVIPKIEVLANYHGHNPHHVQKGEWVSI